MHILRWVLRNPIPSYLTYLQIGQHFGMLELAPKWVEPNQIGQGALHEYEPHQPIDHLLGPIRSIGESRACECALSHKIDSVKTFWTTQCDSGLPRDRGFTDVYIIYFPRITVWTLGNASLSSGGSITT